MTIMEAVSYTHLDVYKRQVKASLVATLGLTVTMIVLNIIYAVPLFARFANFDINKTYGMSKYLLTMIVPLSLIHI